VEKPVKLRKRAALLLLVILILISVLLLDGCGESRIRITSRRRWN